MKLKIRRLVAFLVAPLALLVGAPFVGTAHAAVMCGDTITANTTLTADVGPCAGDGLIAGASNITIDLNGHRVFGTTGLDDALGVGVRIQGQSNVTVTSTVAGGQIDHFDGGVKIEGTSAAATGNTVSNLVIRDNFTESPLGSDDGEGVSIVGPQADNNTVQGNAIVNNGPFGGVSVYLGTSANKITGTVITGNTIHDNRSQGSQTIGIRLENWTWSSTVTNNDIRRSSLEGLSLFADTDFATVSGNTIKDNGASGDHSHRPGDGIHAFARANNHSITSNVVNDNAGSGIVVDSGNTGNSVTNNTALNNGTNPLVLIEAPPVVTVRVGRITVAVLGGVAGVSLPSAINGPYYDLKDGTTGCTTTTWSGNTYGTRNQMCIS